MITPRIQRSSIVFQSTQLSSFRLYCSNNVSDIAASRTHIADKDNNSFSQGYRVPIWQINRRQSIEKRRSGQSPLRLSAPFFAKENGRLFRVNPRGKARPSAPSEIIPSLNDVAYLIEVEQLGLKN